MVQALPPLPGESIAVRMYRGLLGDCFLLTHRIPGAATYRALIDCGVLQRIGPVEKKPSTEAGLQHIHDVVADLAREVRDAASGHPTLDLVIATHEHYDHLSGFIREHESFADFVIRRVWLAWTENPNDALANDIRENGRKALSALKSIVERRELFTPDPHLAPGAASKARLAADAQIDGIDALLQFYDDDIPTWGLGVAGDARPAYDPADPPRSCADALDWLKAAAGEANVSYLEPGQVVSFGAGDGGRLKASVLGPPRTAQRLLQLDPSAGPQREVYLVQPDEVRALDSTLRFRGLEPPAGSEEADGGPPVRRPFADRFNRTAAELAACDVAQLYFWEAEEGRRIDGDWLGAASALALKIDNDVNNTSLALAVELPGPERHVLLFPADAQVGNWLSWHDQTYPAKPPKPDDPTCSAAELLSRVVLYKVGHHGSHNATAREKGLELMTSPHLVAMMPLVEKTAQEQSTATNPDGWAMPYPDLDKRLNEKTRGRILRGDAGRKGPETTAFAAAGSIFQLGYADGEEPLWVELTLSLDGATTGPRDRPRPRRRRARATGHRGRG